MILLFFLYSYCKTSMDLSSKTIIKEFKSHCESNLNFVDSPLELVHLAVVFRHGDRAPLKIKGSNWKNKDCIYCEDRVCNTVRCRDGMLTEKGFDQAKKIGEFIEKFYIPKFSTIEKFKGYYSKIGRTTTTLEGVIKGLGKYECEIELEDSIVNNYNSSLLKSILTSDNNSDSKVSTRRDYHSYDRAMTSLCSGAAFDCNSFNCDSQQVYNFIKSKESLFLENIEKTRQNVVANGISLGSFGIFLENILSERNGITLISGHDSTIVKLLIGLNIKMHKLPAYSSAVFIEVLKTPENKEYIRVIYDGKVQEIGLFHEEYVEAKNFITYLQMFNTLNKTLNQKTKLYVKSIEDDEELENLIKSTKKVYKPLIKELKEKNLFSSLLAEEKGEDSVILGLFNMLKSTYSNSSLQQYLFGGLFGKAKENEKVQVKIEVENKSTGEKEERIMECDSSKDGACKILSTNKKEKDSAKEKNSSGDKSKNKTENKKPEEKNAELNDGKKTCKPANSCSECQKPKGHPCELDKTEDTCGKKKEAAAPCGKKISSKPGCQEPVMYELNAETFSNDPKPCDKMSEPAPCDKMSEPATCDKMSGSAPCDKIGEPAPCDKMNEPEPCQKCGFNKSPPKTCESEPTIKTFFEPKKESYFKIFPAATCKKKPANLFNIGCNIRKPEILAAGKCRKHPIPGVTILDSV